jgi:predicted DNA-binding protein YlxM (UPF0122 family)
VCELIATTDLGLSAIAESVGLHRDTVYQWIYRDKAFADKYARARESQQERMAEQILAIADDSSNDTEIDEDGNRRQNAEWTNRSRLRVETRKWLMSKLAPKKYGERQTVEHEGEMSIKTVILQPPARQNRDRPALKPSFEDADHGGD